MPKATSRQDFIDECKSGALDGVLVAYRTFDSFSLTGKIDGEIVDALPASLKFICHNGEFPDSNLFTTIPSVLPRLPWETGPLQAGATWDTRGKPKRNADSSIQAPATTR